MVMPFTLCKCKGVELKCVCVSMCMMEEVRNGNIDGSLAWQSNVLMVHKVWHLFVWTE